MESCDIRKEDQIFMHKVEGPRHDMVRSCVERQNKKMKNHNKDLGYDGKNVAINFFATGLCTNPLNGRNMR